MRVPRLLPAAAAIAGLLAAGCDYWRNLVDTKAVTVVPLRIQVRDAFTGKPLEEAHCTDSARGIDFTTDSTGDFAMEDAGTGSYDLLCNTKWYYDRTMHFDLRGNGGTFPMGLARRGGDQWYPEDPGKKIRALEMPSQFRTPLTFKITAYPPVDNGTFRYEWTFANNPRFNQYFARESAGKSFFILIADPAKVFEGPDVLTLRVKSRLAGHEEYLVDSASIAVNWTRNVLPTLKLSANREQIRVGCGPIGDSISIGFEADDSDGHCDSVVFQAMDSASAFGRIYERRNCNDPRRFVLHPKNIFGGSREEILTANEKLFVSVYDDNKEHTDSTMSFTVTSNSLPTVSSGKASRGTIFFTNEPVSYWIAAKDSDGPVYDRFINWGDGEEPKVDLKQDNVHFLLDTLTHAYQYPKDSVIVRAGVVDNCGDVNEFQNREYLTIRKDINPDIVLTPQSNPYPSIAGKIFYQVQLTVKDLDVYEGLDRFTHITIDWGDSTIVDTSTQVGKEFDQLLRHHFSTPPALGERRLRVEVFDDHNGRNEATLDIPAQPLP